MRLRKTIPYFFPLFLVLTQENVGAAGPTTIPGMIPYSGTVTVTGTPSFNGNGQFKFAIVNGHADCKASPVGPACIAFWSNDGTTVTGNEPGTAVTIPVNNGLFSVKLGDVSLTNMAPIPSAVFDHVTTYLRVWFNDGTTGFQLLSPDRQLVSVPYAYRSEAAGNGVPTGAVMSFNLPACPSGWSEMTAARGRYIVGLQPGGTLGGATGTALTNNENRPAGQHTHSINDPGHIHGPSDQWAYFGTADSGSLRRPVFAIKPDDTLNSDVQVNASNITGISINAFGSVPGTNAPYIQLLVCQKD